MSLEPLVLALPTYGIVVRLIMPRDLADTADGRTRIHKRRGIGRSIWAPQSSSNLPDAAEYCPSLTVNSAVVR
jgi:hypothetical protein